MSAHKCTPNCIACLAQIATAGIPSLEEDQPMDPLDIAQSIDCREGEVWRLCRSDLEYTVWVIVQLGKPARGFIVCRDEGIYRHCRRFNAQGRELGYVSGVRIRGVSTPEERVQRVMRAVEQMGF